MSEEKKDRIDLDKSGEVDDVALWGPDLFRFERMNDGCVWIKVYRKDAEDVTLRLYAESKKGEPAWLRISCDELEAGEIPEAQIPEWRK